MNHVPTRGEPCCRGGTSSNSCGAGRSCGTTASVAPMPPMTNSGCCSKSRFEQKETKVAKFFFQGNHMKHYIGVKMVQAEFERKDGKDGYAVVYEDGYRSWSPKDVFDRAYFLVGED